MIRFQMRGLVAAATLVVAATSASALAADLSVTVAYTGKAAVDAKHDILVFLFADANITEASIPITVQNIPKSGGSATFKNVTQDPVYVVMVFNEQANYTGQDGPPPPGLPWAIYSKGGKPIPVSAAKTPQVKVTFDDSRRWAR
jgi:hypothetical protein